MERKNELGPKLRKRLSKELAALNRLIERLLWYEGLLEARLSNKFLQQKEYRNLTENQHGRFRTVGILFIFDTGTHIIGEPEKNSQKI